LEFEVKVDPELNSGVQIRSHQYERETEVLTLNQERLRRKQPKGRVYGYQVEISNEQAGASGGIYDEARRGWLANISSDPAARAAFRDNQWNKYRVEAKGDHIRVWVNSVPCADLIDSQDLDGFIGLQVHQFAGPHPKQVRWRNLRIQDLGRHSWKPLSDGKSFEGWTEHPGGKWEIANGAFRGTQTPDSSARGFLLTKDEFSDFTVRMEYKAIKGNSGFFFRMRDPKLRIGGPLGYEVEVDPTRDPGGLQEVGGRGWLHHTGPSGEAFYYRPGEWNQLTVSAHGRRINVQVNGHTASETKDDPGPERGRFGLQLNPKQEIEVLFRNVEILVPER
jgi:hypothetical protein